MIGWVALTLRPRQARQRKAKFCKPPHLRIENAVFAGLTLGTQARVYDFSTHTYFRSRLLKGDARNGFAVLAQGGNYYTGVLHTADLGAPIRTASGRAEWRAFLIVQDKPGGAATEIRKRFDLTVIFGGGGNGEITGRVKDDIARKRSPVIYGIAGNYDPRGVITGTFTETETQITAPISGIIGQAGAIGVFASNETGNKFAGGFVALPYQVQDVTYDNVWTATHEAGRDGLFATPPRIQPLVGRRKNGCQWAEHSGD